MFLFIGLGNKGSKYQNNRHNTGFLFVDYLVKKYGLLKTNNKLKCTLYKGSILNNDILLSKPETMMNLSGESVRDLISYYKLDKEDFIVVYDDMSMDFWKTRYRDKGRPGWHNGIKDIVRFYGEEFKRVKVGIGFNQLYGVSDWVLSKFTPEERIDLENEVYNKIQEIIESKL